MPEKKGKNYLNDIAIISFVFSFFQPVAGLILGIIALSRINKTGERGKGLATAAIIISALLTVFAIITALVFAAAMAAMMAETGLVS
ncbi:MAG: DUF4190 domain-containing protein [Candidatus Woesearchaeota archaeon]